MPFILLRRTVASSMYDKKEHSCGSHRRPVMNLVILFTRTQQYLFSSFNTGGDSVKERRHPAVI